MTQTERPTERVDKGERAARLSLRFLWWLPLSPILGFLVANRFLSESWPISQVVPLALILATPFAIGAYFGLKAIRLGDRQGWVGFAAHVVMMAIALGMPIAQALS